MIDPIFITLGPYVGVAAIVVPLVAGWLGAEFLYWLIARIF